MPPKELNRHQISNRLQFQSHTPAFLKAFQAKVSGRRVNDDEDAPQYENADEYEQGLDGDGFGQEPMVDEFGREIRRESPSNDRRERNGEGGSGRQRDEYGRDRNHRRGIDDEEDEDEKPQIVVLKEGKHLTEREAENERRKANGLSPLPEPEGGNAADEDVNPKSSATRGASKALGSGTKASSKSAVQIGGKVNAAAKRKAPISTQDGEEPSGPKVKKQKTEGKDSEKKKKKASKNLLSFGDDG